MPEWLARAAANYPDRLAVRQDDLTWSFAELDRHAARLATTLAALGARPGERVALLAGNSAAYVAAVHAVARCGAILVPLNTRLAPEEAAWQIADCRPTLLLTDAEHAAVAGTIGNVRHATLAAGPAIVSATLPAASLEQTTGEFASGERMLDLDATQAIIYTSGTTGQPKGALITFGMQWWSAVASALHLGLRAEDRWLATLPFFHIGGLSVLMKSAIYGMGIESPSRFTPERVNAALLRGDVTQVSVVAVMLQRMLAALPPDAGYPPAVRCVLLGGGPAPEPLLRECARRGIPVAQTYGLTEACSQATTLAPADALRKLGSAGRPLAPVALRIARDDGTPAPPAEAGEIWLRGPTITPGYWERPDAAAAFRDGWLRTGDVGRVDADGFLTVLDRRADLIVSGGENVYPAEIEAVLLAHPDVLEAGVCGVDDPQWGRVPVAIVRLRAGARATPAELVAHAAARLARYKVPRAVHLTGPLPRNAAGKLLRRALPALLDAGTAGG